VNFTVCDALSPYILPDMKKKSMVYVSGKTVPTAFIKALSLSVTITLGMLSFEDKIPFTIVSAQVKYPLVQSEERRNQQNTSFL